MGLDFVGGEKQALKFVPGKFRPFLRCQGAICSGRLATTPGSGDRCSDVVIIWGGWRMGNVVVARDMTGHGGEGGALLRFWRLWSRLRLSFLLKVHDEDDDLYWGLTKLCVYISR